MNATRLLAVNARSARALELCLQECGSRLSVTDALDAAIRQWVETQEAGGMPQEADHGGRGYRWKCLFLPHGTRLRMEAAGLCHHAQVVDDAIIHAGRSVSPRQFTLAVAGNGRNAWRDLWVRRPADGHWKRASQLRRAVEQGGREPLSPVDAMNHAAQAMSNTLKTALALVEQANALALPQFERRRMRARRDEDVLADMCAAD